MGKYDKQIKALTDDIRLASGEFSLPDSCWSTKEEVVKPASFPDDVREFFLELVAENIRIQHGVRLLDGETYDPKEEMELNFKKVSLADGRIAWVLGIHDALSPACPSGYDFYAIESSGDGALSNVLWTES